MMNFIFFSCRNPLPIHMHKLHFRIQKIPNQIKRDALTKKRTNTITKTLTWTRKHSNFKSLFFQHACVAEQSLANCFAGSQAIELFEYFFNCWKTPQAIEIVCGFATQIFLDFINQYRVIIKCGRQ